MKQFGPYPEKIRSMDRQALTTCTFKCHFTHMETVSVTTARQNLGAWLARAAKGEEIGIISGSQIIALRPVVVTAADYAFQEYGLQPDEMNRITAKLHEEVSTAAAIPYLGSLADALAQAGDADEKVSSPSKGSARPRASGNRRRASLIT